MGEVQAGSSEENQPEKEISALLEGYIGKQVIAREREEAAQETAIQAELALRELNEALDSQAQVIREVFRKGVVIDGVKDGHGLTYHAGTKLPTGYENGLYPLTEEQIAEHTHEIWKPITEQQISRLTGLTPSDAEDSRLGVSVVAPYIGTETEPPFDLEPSIRIYLARSMNSDRWRAGAIYITGKLSDIEWHPIEADATVAT